MKLLDYARWRCIREVPAIIDTLATEAKQGNATAARLMLELAGLLLSGEGGGNDGEEKRPPCGLKERPAVAKQ
ncbi:hypothetical protein SDD30_14900 [Moorella naiadis]|uniref:hypothetical protein n=1 Tax=Moorella naiadis (nom. illeg.) TaxID=3093670 RepID=UPI003D9CB91D